MKIAITRYDTDAYTAIVTFDQLLKYCNEVIPILTKILVY